MRFGLLGPVTAHDDTGRALALGAPKNLALLTVLLLDANRTVSLDRIKAALWGERPPASATSSVHNHVTRLRRALGPAGGLRLRAAPPGYLIEVGAEELDGTRFTDLLRAADAARRGDDWPAVGERARAALALWRGEPLTGVVLAEQADTAARPTVERWRQGRLQALEWRFEAELRAGGHAALLPELAGPAAEHPLLESFQRQLMLALHRCGRQSEALAVYHRLRRRLVEELGVEPGAEAQAAYHEILTHPAAAPTPAPGPTPYRPPSQLPRDIADFTGRQGQVRQLLDLLTPAPGGGPLGVVAVSGAGGLGKTTLAVHSAHRAAACFPDGQLYMDLRGVQATPATPSDILACLLRDLGEPEDRIPASEDSRAARYRSLLADRRVLVVLDNARDAAQVRPLLPGSAGCAVLVTSRRRLGGLAGAVHLGLSTLADTEAHELFAALAGHDRTAAEPAATARVVAHCAGLPLALRIAAARLAGRTSWNVSTLADRLADHTRRLDELRVEDLAVRATFQMSYAQLASPQGPEEIHPALAFRLLGLAPGPEISLRAAAALLDHPAERVEDALEQLVDACLLESVAPERYRLHDLLRDFAAERAAAEEPTGRRRAAVGRVTGWYLDSLVEADAVLFPGAARPELPVPQPGHRPHGFRHFQDAVHWCETERTNLVRATAAATEHGFHRTCWLLPGFAWAYLNLMGRWQDWLDITEAGLAGARAAGDPAGESTVLTARGAAFMQLERWSEALHLLRAALRIRQETGDVPGQMSSTCTIGLVYRRTGQREEARAAFLQALAFVGPPELRKREVTVLANLALIELELGRYADALAYSERALRAGREFNELPGDANTLVTKGAALSGLGRDAEAVAPFQESVMLARYIGDRFCEGMALARLALALTRLARTAEAEAAVLEARAVVEVLAERAAAWQADAVRAQLDGVAAAALTARGHAAVGQTAVGQTAPAARSGLPA
ncbi:BTAD domain-containing putative transcriptional regulator [Kitasatospora sp. NPDC048540]|uniref:AfsR/SARP family transcriptional regulator n=1 Tax=Kitasatospora sp. NPDC048540 TaxID=3155634 RepID=UPI0033C11CF4